MRGFLSGMIWGVVTAVVGLSVASLIAPQPAGNRPPDAPLVDAPAEAQGETEVATAAPGPATAEMADPPAAVAAGVPAPPTDDSALAVADTAPAEVPDLTRTVEALPAPPEMPAAVEDVGAEASPVDAATVGRAPVVPAPEAEIEAETASAEPMTAAAPAPVPEVTEAVTLPVMDDQPSAPDAAPVVGAADDQAPLTATGVDALAVPADPRVAGAPAPGEDAPPALPERAQAILPPVADMVTEGGADGVGAEPAPRITDDAAPSVAGAEGPVVAISPGLPAGTGAEAATLPQVEAPRDESSAPAAPAEQAEALPGVNGEARLPGGTADVVVNRLAPPATDAPAAAEEEPALVRFAANWTSAGGLPQMAIVLVDDGALAGAAAAVAALPVPVTVAVEPGAAGEASLDAYRAEGIEVMAVSRLPEGATPTDVAVTFEAVLARMPEIIGMIDTGAGGLQDQFEVTEQAMARLAAEGMGAVVPSGGLNMAARVAADAGVPVAMLSREIDPAGSDAAAIRRALDQAAFRARQESGEVLLGRVEVETLSALMLWGTGAAAAQVEVAPVSAILRAGGG